MLPSQYVASAGEWGVTSLASGELPFEADTERRSQWRVVLKLEQGAYVPWLLVGPSAFLHSIGKTGDGLYALHALRGPGKRGVTYSKGDVLGGYAGESIAGPFVSTSAPKAKAAGIAAARRGKEHLLWVERPGTGWLLVDGEHAGVPFMHKMNDTRTEQGNNVKFEPSGVARATKAIPPVDLLGARALAELRSSELLVPYGAQFWAVHALRICSFQ